MHVAIHTFPVRDGLSPEAAWDLIARDEYTGTDANGIELPCGWANALLIDGTFKGILPVDQDEAAEFIDRAKGLL